MNILFLTSRYPGPDIPSTSTAVCHYFTKEWVRAGHNVVVIHNMTTFPKIVNWGLRLFSDRLERKSGLTFSTSILKEMDYELDGVKVFRRNIFKLYPRRPFRESDYNKQLNKILTIIKDVGFTPNVIVGHWWTPQLRLVCELGNIFRCKKVIVAHGVLPLVYKEFGQEKGQLYLRQLDMIGYRSKVIKERCMKRYHLETIPYFMCYSGIPKEFGNMPEKKINSIKNFTFVGNLIDRKHPEKLLEALCHRKDEGITINYVGDGPMLQLLKQKVADYSMESVVNFYGRVSREEVGHILKNTDCFIMISRGETFGLVYLEAMAYGCITIGARNEGIDGPIRDGENGFLCEAGNTVELRKIIDYISEMTNEEINEIAIKGQLTSNELTDINVANYYLQNLQKCVL